ncbi:hypothetical protein [Luteimonas aquatica]|uniref:hypothetical protein n=1 Tax=Luteimonas aquatica TaxID=450364 RepID=UPI001F5AC9A8|nr:hypothetical protein [Luteimonas aquatica]
MSEDQTPYTPPQSPIGGPQARPPADARGSLGIGIALFFACLVGGAAVAFLLRIVLMAALLQWDSTGPGPTIVLVVIPLLLPWLAVAWLAVHLVRRGQTRSALGLLVGFGILAAIVLLLVAACFSLFAL